MIGDICNHKVQYLSIKFWLVTLAPRYVTLGKSLYLSKTQFCHEVKVSY